MATSFSRRLARLLGRVFRWTLWLVLIAALAVQLRILSDGGLRLPAFARDEIIRRLADRGISFQAEAIWLDPAGRILLVHPRLGLAGQNDPFASAHGVVVSFQRRALLAGEFRATRVEVADLSLSLPARLSPTGATQSLMEAGEFRLSHAPGSGQWSVDQASARLLSIPAAFSGTLPAVDATAGTTRAPAALARDIVRQAASLYRQLARLPLDRLRVVRVDLSPERLALSTELPALARSDYPSLPASVPDFSFSEVRADILFPLGRDADEPAELRLRARSLQASAPLALEGDDVVLRLAARAAVLDSAATTGEPISVSIAASRVRKTDSSVPAIPLVADARFTPNTGKLDLEFSTRLADTPWMARISGSAVDRSGEVTATGSLTPALLDQVRPFLPEKARPILQLTDPLSLAVSAEFAPGAKPARVVARAASGRAVAGHVPFNRAGAVLLYEPGEHRFRADELLLAQGDSLAVGSYEMDTETLAFRFLLDGPFRPASISGWFSGWWDRFWEHFHFGPVAPAASVDIQGVWREPDLTTVFVGAASGPMRLRDLDLDTLHTRVRVAAGSTDLIGFRGTKGPCVAEGGALRLLAHDHDTLVRLHFDVRSDFPIDALPRLFPDEGAALTKPFALESSPRIHLVGETHGPASATPTRQRYDLALSVDAPMRYSGFPLDHLSLRVERRDADVHLRDIRAGFASGLATGEATLSGPEADRWLAFDVSLSDANLDLVQTRWREFQTIRPASAPTDRPASSAKKKVPASSAKESKPTGGKISARLAATGPLENPLAYSGAGEARITGADLANIRLMGPVSSVLGEIGIKFTTLVLTEAEARLSLDQNRLAFQELRLTGPSALVEAKGVYALPEGTLDFKAKIHPFEQGGGILSSTASFVTSPLSSVLEVDLAGTLDEPTWSFSYGPTKLLRRLF